MNTMPAMQAVTTQIASVPVAAPDKTSGMSSATKQFRAEIRRALQAASHHDADKAQASATPAAPATPATPAAASASAASQNEAPEQNGVQSPDAAAIALMQQFLSQLAANPQMPMQQIQGLAEQFSISLSQYQIAGGKLPAGPSADQLVKDMQAAMKQAGSIVAQAGSSDTKQVFGASLADATNQVPAEEGSVAQKTPSVQQTVKFTDMKSSGTEIPKGLQPVEPEITLEVTEQTVDRKALANQTQVSLYHMQGDQLQTPATKEAAQVGSVRDIPDQIQKAVESGNKQIVIRLDPPDLGQVHIRLRMNQGVLTADLKVDSGSTRDVFTSAMPQIRASLEQAGIRVGELQVDLHDDYVKDQGARHGQNNSQNPNQQRNQAPREQFFEYLA